MSEPNFDGLDSAAVQEMINRVLARCMEPRWREAWWSSDLPQGLTPRKLLDTSRYTELWLIADAQCDPDTRYVAVVNLN
jgi:hypothetical protein